MEEHREPYPLLQSVHPHGNGRKGKVVAAVIFIMFMCIAAITVWIDQYVLGMISFAFGLLFGGIIYGLS